MKPLPISSVLAQPWAMEPARFAALAEDVRAGRFDGEAPAPAMRPAVRNDGVAVIPITGPLVNATSPIEEMLAAMFGATTYSAIQSAVADAVAAGFPILLDVNSPGGMVDGVIETADAIRAARDRVPVVAHIRGMGASAAYWLASQAERITAQRGARVGSIGVVATLADDSGAQAQEGIKRIQVVSSQSPAKRSDPVDSEVVGRIQRQLDDMAALFVEQVAAGRQASTETVLANYGQGDVLIASKAMAAGMVDAVGPLAASIGAAQSLAQSRRGKPMNAQTDSAQPRAAMDDMKCNGCQKDMAAAEKCYCAGCAGEEGAKAKLGAEAMKALGAANVDEAAGALIAAAEALKDIGPLRAEVQTLRATANKQQLRAVLERGIAAGRLSLGDLSATVPNMLTDDARTEAMVKALDERKETTATATIDAICSVEVTGAEVKRIEGWAARKAPTMAPPVEPPARDAKAEAAEAEELDDTARKVAAAAEAARKTLDRNRTKTAAGAAK